MLLACKHVYNETLPLLYSQNTVAVVDPYLNFLCIRDLRPAIQQMITSVDLNVPSTLSTIAGMLGTLCDECPNLTNLTLTFYLFKGWLTEAAKFIYHAWVMEDVTVKLDLHASECADENGKLTKRDMIAHEIHEAMDFGRLFRLQMADHLKTITVAASVMRGQAAEFAAFSDALIDWQFKGDDTKKNDLKCQHFVWCPKKEKKTDSLEQEEKSSSLVQEENSSSLQQRNNEGESLDQKDQDPKLQQGTTTNSTEQN